MRLPRLGPRQIFFLICLSAAVVAVFKAWPYLLVYPGLDEGIVLSGGERLLAGQVIYRDFFAFWPPGSYMVAAATIFLFGNSVLAINTISLFVQILKIVLVACITYQIFLRKETRYIFLGVVAYFTNVIVIYLSYNHKLWSQLFFIAGLAAITYFHKNKQSLFLGLAGLATGLCAFITQTEGSVLFLCILAYLFWQKLGLRQYVLFFSAVAVIWIPFFVYLLATKTFHDFFAQVILFPLIGYQTITQNYVSNYIGTIVNNFFSTAVVSKLLIPLGILIFGVSLIISKILYIKSQARSVLGRLYLLVAVLFLMCVYYLGASPFFWGLLYLSVVEYFGRYSDYIPPDFKKKVLIGANMLSILISINCFGSLIKNFSFNLPPVVNKQVLFAESTPNLKALKFMDTYVSKESSVFIGCLTYQYFLYNRIPATFLDVHGSNGYTLPYMLDKEIASLQRVKPELLIVDAEGLKFRSSTVAKESDFFKTITKEYRLIDTFYEPELAGSHLEKIEVFERKP